MCLFQIVPSLCSKGKVGFPVPFWLDFQTLRTALVARTTFGGGLRGAGGFLYVAWPGDYDESFWGWVFLFFIQAFICPAAGLFNMFLMKMHLPSEGKLIPMEIRGWLIPLWACSACAPQSALALATSHLDLNMLVLAGEVPASWVSLSFLGPGHG